MTNVKLKVIFDTNVWISFLIGKRLLGLKHLISKGKIIIVTTEQLLLEIEIITQKSKFSKYFSPHAVEDLLILLNTISLKFDVQPFNNDCRDPKDNFLLDLIMFSKSDYLVTGDKDLLDMNIFLETRIISPAEFEKIISDIEE
jgi:putative PIN family toxin of toxin-antitoxin system